MKDFIKKIGIWINKKEYKSFILLFFSAVLYIRDNTVLNIESFPLLLLVI